MKSDKTILKEQFKKIYKNCEPLAFHLNGFTHSVYYLDYNDLKVKKEVFCGYMSASETKLYEEFTDRAKLLFMGFPHYQYQNNAKELIVHLPGEIEKLKTKTLRG